MKKKLLLLTVLVIALTCIFAITVSAADPNYDGEKSPALMDGHEGLPLYDTDGNGLIWYISATDENGKNTYDYVANNATDTTLSTYVVYNIWSGYDTEHKITPNQLNGGPSIKSAGTTYDYKTIVVANFRGNAQANGKMITSFQQTFQGSTNIQHVYVCEKFQLLKASPFSNCTNLTTFDLTNTSIVAIGQNSFAHTNIKSIGTLPNTLKSFYGAFENMYGLESINIPSSVDDSISTAPSLTKNVFLNCKALHTITGLEDYIVRNNVTTIPSQCFYNCQKLTNIFGGTNGEVVIPHTITVLDTTAFRDCDEFTKIWVSPNVTSFGNYDVFYGMPKLTTLYFSDKCLTVPKNTFLSSTNITTVFFVGSKANAEAFIASAASTGNNGAITGLTLISAADYEKLTDKSGKYFVYDYNACVAFYGNKHLNAITYGFDGEDKYTSNYCKFDGCTRCSNKTTTTYGKLFTNKGYSKETNGTYFVYGIVFNKDVISLYLANTEGATFSYGLVAAKYTAGVSTGALFDEEGNTVDNCVAIDATKPAYSVYSLKITDLDKVDGAKAQAIYCCAYIVDNGAIKYVANDVTDTAVTICYDDIDVTIETTTPPVAGDETQA